ncbi:MAG: hypothetical protein JSV56_00865 [Methanomassiliicoccales archaeon]|nr:MAG: hypothetical protein JSV56_00865 [Methanomassiliicoccales archaeon]
MKNPSGLKNQPLKDCNCLNCRLGRIEDQLEMIQDHIQYMNSNNNKNTKKKNTKKKASKKNSKKSKKKR